LFASFIDTNLIVTFNDVTERSAALERSKNLFENSPLGISVTHLDGTVNFNKRFCSLLGYTQKILRKKIGKNSLIPMI
jgi:PAS domain S-box-containing protein